MKIPNPKLPKIFATSVRPKTNRIIISNNEIFAAIIKANLRYDRNIKISVTKAKINISKGKILIDSERLISMIKKNMYSKTKMPIYFTA